MDCRYEARCVDIDCKRQRRMLMKLRGGTAELRIEIPCVTCCTLAKRLILVQTFQ